MKVRNVCCLATLFSVTGLMAMDKDPAQELKNAIAKAVFTSKGSKVDIDQILAKNPGFEPNILFSFKTDRPAAVALMKKFLAYCDTCDPQKSWRPIVLNHVKNDLTPLHAAVIAGNCNMVQALIQEGANVRVDVEEDTVRRGSWPLTTAVYCYCSCFKTDQEKLDNYAQIIQTLQKHTIFKGDGWHLNWQTIKGTVGELFYLDGRTVLPAVGPTGGVKYLLPDCLKFVENEWPKGEPAQAVPLAQNHAQNQNPIPNKPIQAPAAEQNNLANGAPNNPNQPPRKQDSFSFTRTIQNRYFLAGFCAFLLVSLTAYKYLRPTQENDDDTESEDQEEQTIVH